MRHQMWEKYQVEFVFNTTLTARQMYMTMLMIDMFSQVCILMLAEYGLTDDCPNWTSLPDPLTSKSTVHSLHLLTRCHTTLHPL